MTCDKNRWLSPRCHRRMRLHLFNSSVLNMTVVGQFGVGCALIHTSLQRGDSKAYRTLKPFQRFPGKPLKRLKPNPVSAHTSLKLNPLAVALCSKGCVAFAVSEAGLFPISEPRFRVMRMPFRSMGLPFRGAGMACRGAGTRFPCFGMPIPARECQSHARDCQSLTGDCYFRDKNRDSVGEMCGFRCCACLFTRAR